MPGLVPGDAISLLTASGWLYRGRIGLIERASIQIEILSRQAPQAPVLHLRRGRGFA